MLSPEQSRATCGLCRKWNDVQSSCQDSSLRDKSVNDVSKIFEGIHPRAPL